MTARKPKIAPAPAPEEVVKGIKGYDKDLKCQCFQWVFDRAKLEEGAHAVGPSGAASATGPSGAASATGVCGAVMGANGCALFLVYRTPHSGEIMHAWAGIAGRGGIKPLVWYRLNESGQPVEINAP